MPLSEEELRLLEQMERALVAEDPKFASALKGSTLQRNARRRALIGAAGFVVGVVVLMTGAVTATTFVGIIGFVIMLGSAVVGLTAWRSRGETEAQATDEAGVDSPEQAFGLTVVEGGKSRPKKRSKPTRGKSSGQSMMARFEERWRRRREGGGF